MYDDEIPIGRAENIRGKKFGHLTVLYRVANKGKKTQWKCVCDCGKEIIATKENLVSGNTKSCGCQRGIHIKDITGQRFGLLTAIRPTTQENHKWKWLCKCDCGNEIEIFSDYLTQGTKSCGCLKLEVGHNNASRLEGKRFGKLTVIKEAYRKDYSVFWECLCDCGTTIYTTSSHLNSGHTSSCGCVRSKGEELISKLLNQFNYSFQKEKTFSSCLYEGYGIMRFDFYVNNKYLIEYDGSQHFTSYGSGWNTKEQVIETQKRDAYKNQWCRENNIPLIRIPYTKLDTLCIEDLMLETTKFRVV